MMILHATIGQNNHNRKKKPLLKIKVCVWETVCVCVYITLYKSSFTQSSLHSCVDSSQLRQLSDSGGRS